MSGPAPQLKSEIVRAGAGAGKTTELVTRVMGFSQEFRAREGRWPRLVVTTFTRKATQELRQRLINEACQRQDVELQKFFSRPGGVLISTIHGVCGQFLRRLGHLVGLDSEFRIVEESIQKNKAREILRKILNEDYSKLLEDHGYSGLADLLLEYKERKRIYPDCGPASQEVLKSAHIEEFHLRMERFKARVTSMTSQLGSTAADQKWGVYLQRVLKSMEKRCSPDEMARIFKQDKPRFNAKENSFSAEEKDLFLSDLKDLSDFAEHESTKPEALELIVTGTQKFHELAERFVAEFNDYQSKLSEVTMGELESLTLSIVLNYPQVADLFSGQWDYWFIDEFQDTSPLQLRILDHFVKEAFYVGDPQQSIYYFRGARFEIFNEQYKRLLSKGASGSERMLNYRSSPQVMRFINEAFSRLKVDFAPMDLREAADSDQIPMGLAPVEILLAQKEEELACVKGQVKNLLGQGVPPQEICILAPRREPLLFLAQSLKGLGIPVELKISGAFSERREVQDLLAMLRFLLSPHDTRNLLLLLRSPWFCLEDEIILTACKEKVGSLWAHLVDASQLEPISRLERHLRASETQGVIETLFDMVLTSGFLQCSGLQDVTGIREANLVKVLARLSEASKQPGFNFLAFAEELSAHESSESGDDDALASRPPSSVQLMTIHGSKGLQFPYVLVLGLGNDYRDSSGPPRGLSRTLNEKHFALRSRWVDGRWCSPIFDEIFRQERVTRERAERRRLFYVAMTRARKHLSLFLPPNPGVKSVAQEMALDLDLGSHQDLSYVVKEFKATTEGPVAPSGPPRSSRVRFSSKMDLSNKRKSVTELLSAESHESRAERPSQIRESLDALTRGLEFHSLMERHRYGYDVQEELTRRGWLGAFEFVMSLRAPPMKALLGSGQSEWGFQMAFSELVIEGQVDLWGEAEGNLWIVDYKTGGSSHLERVRSQLNLYSLPISNLQSGKPIFLAAVFPFEKQYEVWTPDSSEVILSRYKLC